MLKGQISEAKTHVQRQVMFRSEVKRLIQEEKYVLLFTAEQV